MKIDIILPYKEIFSPSMASSVSITVKNSMKFSKFKKNITVFGQYTEDPYFKKNFVGIKVNRFLHGGNNISIVKNYLKISKQINLDRKIIEVHNRPYLFNYLTDKIKNLPVILYYHNDPQTMKGSKLIEERKKIIRKAAGIIFVSNYIKRRFLDGIEEKPNNLYVLPNSLDKNILAKNKKQKEVLFVGKLVPEKGAHLYVESTKQLAKQFLNWNFIIIGSSKSRLSNRVSLYEKNIVNSFLKIGNNAKYFGFLPNRKVKQIMQKASIIVVPSIWNEPFGLTALEGISNRLAVISSRVGGLVDIVKERGILIKDITNNKITNKLKELMKSKSKLTKYQNKAWKNYIFGQKYISKKQDSIRQEILNKFKII